MVKKLKYHFAFLILIQVGLSASYGYFKMYDARPYSIHQWRQTDCLSFTKNYYEEGMHFFSPTIHWQGQGKGKAISEFPLINYTVAGLYNVFGEHEFIYRLLVLLIYTVALLFFFAMVYSVSNSLLYSYFTFSLLATSPLLAYYSFSFLADVPALSFSIIALSLFYFYLKQSKNYLFILSVVFGTLASLLKASSATVLLIIGVITLIHLLNFPKKYILNKELFKSKTLIITTLLSSIVVVYLWYHFAFLYNNKNSNGVFLMETLPIWKMNDKVIETARLLYSVQFEMFFNKGVLLVIAFACIWLFFNIKKLSNYLQVFLIIATVAFIAFIILFYQVFNVHDYYLITSMLLPIIILVCFGDYLKTIEFNFQNKKILYLCIIAFFINTSYCAAIVRLRNLNKDTFCKYYPFITNDEKNFSDWFHYNYELTLKPFETITPYLRQLGIKRTDNVISLPDPSFNITLYLMDQKGFTETDYSLSNDSLKLQKDIDFGATYLIVNDTALLTKNYLQKYITQPIGKFKNISLFSLANKK